MYSKGSDWRRYLLALILLWVSVIIFISVLFSRISGKLGLPALLAFIVLGMLFGIDGLVKIPFDNYILSNFICSTALIFIMFYGGFGTKWSEARPVALPATLLATLGVILTAGLTGLFCHFILGMDLLESLLLGSVISSTDAASVFSILRSQKLNLRYGTASLLEIESGSNDPFAYMLSALILTMMKNPVSPREIAFLIFTQISYAVIFGILIASLTLLIFRQFKFRIEGTDAIMMVAVALISYALPAALGGNGYLSAYLVGIIVGNSSIKSKKSLVHFFDGLTGLMQMLIFFLLGLLSTPSELPFVFGSAVSVMFFLTFIARPLAVFGILSPLRCPSSQSLLVSWAGLRGAASIVFATMAIIDSAYGKTEIYHIVFCIVLISILLQGALIPRVSRRLDMIDKNTNVLKTFTDYSEATDIQFTKLQLAPSHPWVSKKVKQLLFPPDCLLNLIVRGGERIIPNGNTLLMAEDILVLSAPALRQTYDIELDELILEKGHSWINARIRDVFPGDSRLIVMIQRDSRIIIPTGNTLLKENDSLIIIE